MNLSHYSPHPITELRAVIEQIPLERTFVWKPRGLWVSVDGEYDWKEWCEGNGWHKPQPVHHRVILREIDSLLHLKDPVEILSFQDQYGFSDGITSYPAIDWARVAQDYPGIIIAPYQWSLRMDLMWYYGWDCASGCIWDTSIIERLEIQ